VGIFPWAQASQVLPCHGQWSSSVITQQAPLQHQYHLDDHVTQSSHSCSINTIDPWPKLDADMHMHGAPTMQPVALISFDCTAVNNAATQANKPLIQGCTKS
jgi:hypothetical protein